MTPSKNVYLAFGNQSAGGIAVGVIGADRGDYRYVTKGPEVETLIVYRYLTPLTARVDRVNVGHLRLSAAFRSRQ